MKSPVEGIIEIRAVRHALWQTLVIIVLAVALGAGTNALRSDGIPLVHDWSPEARLRDGQGNRTDISLEEAARLFHESGAVFFDARSGEEYLSGHIRGARSLPLDDADLVFEETAGEISPDTPLITYCDGEACSLSHDLAGILKEFGFEEVRVLVNGWTLWLEAGLPVEQGLKPDERERSSGGS